MEIAAINIKRIELSMTEEELKKIKEEIENVYKYTIENKLDVEETCGELMKLKDALILSDYN